MASTNFFLDNEDLQFQFENADWDALVGHVEKLNDDEDRFTSGEEAKTFYRDLLETLGNYIAEEIAPHWAELDEQHPTVENGYGKDPPRMKAIMDGLRDMGAMSLVLPRRVGGLNMPMLMNSILSEMLGRADVSVMSFHGFHGGIAQAMNIYALEEGSIETDKDGNVTSGRFDAQIEKMAAGEEWGAMVLTEPGAGSDLGKIMTTATKQDDDSWHINGSKIWITAGHGEHHIVIARSEPTDTHPGLKGLSLFYVPGHIDKDGEKVRNFEVGGIEKKMGQHSGVAATINYDDSVGYLIGQRGHGFRGMLLIMNSARVAVGFEGLGIMEAAYRQAKAHAEERVSMDRPIIRHEMIADMLEEMELSIAGLRALCFEAMTNEEIAQHLKLELKVNPPKDADEKKAMERKMRKHKRRARFATPLIKYYGGEESCRVARMNMQILGGVGYMVEYGAEKLLRDALVLPIYEGTSQIQGLMALKDNIQAALRNPQKMLGEMAAARLEAIRARDPLDRGIASMRGKKFSAIQMIMTRIAASKIGDLRGRPLLEWKDSVMSDWDPRRDFSFGFHNAERFARVLVDVAIAETLVRQAKKAEGTKWEESRRDLALRWMERAEPRTEGELLQIKASGSILERFQKRGQVG